MTLAIGMLVRHRSVTGTARIARIGGTEVLLEQFDSPARPVVAERWVDIGGVRRHVLGQETRVFWRDPVTGRWLAGRVVAGGPDEYFVRHPNSEFDSMVVESDLRARWSQPLLDPLGVLLAGGQESPFYRDSRLPVIRNLAEQRSRSASVSALTSSRIQLHAHQVDAAVRILSDPVQRYLLADEVGLGKTIEAGLVIRQLLIEKPSAKVVVITPAALCGQWEDELSSRFFIDDFPHSVIAFSSHERSGRWWKHADADLVVVDEAHQLITEGDLDAEPYRNLESLALAVPRLLLLSATPVLRREMTHLALLHLLDPDVYALDKVEEFRARIAIRKELASAVFQLDPDYSYLLGDAIGQIRALLPEDERFESLSARVLDCLDDSGDLRADRAESEFVAALSAVRAYIAETYRLHRRVLRNRRRAVLNARLDDAGIMAPFEVTGRRRPRLIALTSYEAGVGREALDEWRRGCRDHLLDTGGDLKPFAQILAVLLSRSGGPVSDLCDALTWRIDRDEAAAQRAGLTEVERVQLNFVPVLPVEREVLRGLQSHETCDAVEELAARLVQRAREVNRLVVFAGRGQLAEALADALESTGYDKVRRHTSTAGIQESEKALSSWQEVGGVLVCDATGDHGLNLQVASAVVHARLAASPNELEQRIGRVDRYGRTASAVQYVVGDRRDAGLCGAWLGLLLDGYRVFEASVSAYQDAIDHGLDMVWRRAFEDGVDGILDEIPGIQAVIIEEAKELARFETLESSYADSRNPRDIAASLADLENENGHGRALLRLLEARDGFGFIVREDRGGIHVSFGDRRPLLGADLLTKFVGLAQASFHGHLDRWQALRTGGRLLAAGNPLTDAVWQVLLLDDRGRATARWRIDRGWKSDPLPYFGFDYHLQADLRCAEAIAAREGRVDLTALRRRADWIFAPVYRRIWLSGDTLVPVIDERVLAWLEAPYRRDGGDVNLNSDRIHALHELFGGPATFGATARDAEAAARQELVRATNLAAVTQTTLAALREEQSVLAAQALARSRASSILVDDGSARLDEELAAAVARGVVEPSLQLMAVNCTVRSCTRWDAN
ncbi:protein DpdE [Micromonospora sp. NPDC005113]